MENRPNDTDSGQPTYPEKNLSQCHLLHYRSHVDWPGIEEIGYQ